VTGVYQDFIVSLYTYMTGSGKHSSTWTSFVVYLPFHFRNVARLRVTREGFLAGITKAFGAQDIHVGDPAFDEAYLIASDTPQFVPHILTPPIRDALLRGTQEMNVTVGDGRVYYAQRGVLTDPGVLSYVLDLLVMIAARVTEVEAPTAPAAQPSHGAQLPPVSVCDNCGADLNWELTGSRGVANCRYCGKTLTFRYGATSFWGR
jgi:hypothetical protein